MTWIAPQIASDDQKIDPNSNKPAPAGKHHYIEAEKEKFRNDPEFHLQYRKKLESALTEMFPVFLRGTKSNIHAKEAMRASMLAKIGPGHEELKEKFIPEWSPGCRRLTPGEGYLETLVLDHVRVIHEEIARFTETGLVTASGEELPFDIIACATGFDIAYVPHFKITGLNGAIMQEEWKETPNIYLSITAPKFPNYFVVNGPTGNWGQGCALPSVSVILEVGVFGIRVLTYLRSTKSSLNMRCSVAAKCKKKGSERWNLDKGPRLRSINISTLGTRNTVCGLKSVDRGTRTTSPMVACISGQAACCTILRLSAVLDTSTTTCAMRTTTYGHSWGAGGLIWRWSTRVERRSTWRHIFATKIHHGHWIFREICHSGRDSVQKFETMLLGSPGTVANWLEYIQISP